MDLIVCGKVEKWMGGYLACTVTYEYGLGSLSYGVFRIELLKRVA